MPPIKLSPEVPEPPTGSSVPPIDYRKTENFRNEYANNIFLEPTAWELKFNFGQTDQSLGLNVITQHTGIAIAWNQVKVLAYFLQIHLAAYETVNGRIKIPKNVINPATPPDKETVTKEPQTVELYKAMIKVYDEFMAANPEAKKELP
jgi:hypothetical protein